jgi:hypothetical protein
MGTKGNYENCLYKILVGKPGRKILIGRLGYKWEDNIKINLTKT